MYENYKLFRKLLYYYVIFKIIILKRFSFFYINLLQNKLILYVF